MRGDHSDKIKRFLTNLGIEIESRSGDELICCCPWCGKEGHFYFNAAKLVFDCKRCEQHGSYRTLLEQLSQDLAANITERAIRALARNRGLPREAFADYGIGYTGRLYTLPTFRPDGRMANLVWFALGGKPYSAPGCPASLFRAEVLGDDSRAGESVYVTEGHWDCIALEWVRKKARKPGVVVGVPGAGTFRSEWARWMRGRDVFLCYDNDEAGATGEARAAAMLAGIAKSIVFFRWQNDEPEQMDMRDLVRGALCAD